MFVEHLDHSRIEAFIIKNFIQKGNTKRFSSVKELVEFANENSCRLTYGMQAYAISLESENKSTNVTAKLISYGGVEPNGVTMLEPSAKITTIEFSDFGVKISCDGVSYSQQDYNKFQKEWVKLNSETFDKGNSQKPYMNAYKAYAVETINSLFVQQNEITK